MAVARGRHEDRGRQGSRLDVVGRLNSEPSHGKSESIDGVDQLNREPKSPVSHRIQQRTRKGAANHAGT